MTDESSSEGLLDSSLLADCSRSEPSDRPNILKALLAIQERIGYVPPRSIPQIARTLGATEADVAGVLSYYQDLRTTAPGRHVIRVCMGESCVANRCGQILRALKDHLGIDIGETDSGGQFTLEKVFCMGNCAVSPTIAVNQTLFGRVEPAQIRTIVDCYR
ncbi:MAG: hypothetical protein GDA67_09415 [Nitrospira sp. CR1.3]|nr:hypothetical protein [Nitrospira sp. CR1.3]